MRIDHRYGMPLVAVVGFFLPTHDARARQPKAEAFSVAARPTMVPPDPDHPEQSEVTNFPAAVQLFATNAASISTNTPGLNCSGTLFTTGTETRLYTAAHCLVLPGKKEPTTLRLTHWTTDKNSAQAMATSSQPFKPTGITFSQSFAVQVANYHWVGAADYTTYEANMHNILFPNGHIETTPSDVAYVPVPSSAGVDAWALPMPKVRGSREKDILLIVAGGCDKLSSCYRSNAPYKIRFGYFSVLERVADDKVIVVPTKANMTRPGDSGGPAFFSTSPPGVLSGIVSAGQDGTSNTLLNELSFN